MVIERISDRINENGCILIGRCEHDDSVRFPFYWCEEIIKIAKEKGFEVIDLQNEKRLHN